MIVPRFTQDRCLVLTDSDIGSLLACAMASEQQSISSAEPSVLIPSWWRSCTEPEFDLILSALEPSMVRHAEIYGLQILQSMALYPAESAQPTAIELAHHQTTLLTEAAYTALELGLRRVVWPVRVPEDHPGRIAAIGDLIDRALLISRLVSLDASPQTAPEVRIETPFVDLSDAQMVELAQDMALPVETCWWAQAPTLESSQVRSSQWGGAGTRHAAQLEPKPGVQTPT